jgi:hypothetical protein
MITTHIYVIVTIFNVIIATFYRINVFFYVIIKYELKIVFSDGISRKSSKLERKLTTSSKKSFTKTV